MVHITYDKFVEGHRNQLESSNVPQHFWVTLFRKLMKQTFDAGNTFSLLKIEYEPGSRKSNDRIWQLQVIDEVKYSDPEHVYLIDHAWTYRAENARKELLKNAGLRNRLVSIMGVESCASETDEAEKLFDELWRYNNFYSIRNATNIEEQLPVWYIMDEVGSAIQHCDEPNFRMVPFIHTKTQMTYSIIFPIKDLCSGTIVCRDFAEGVPARFRDAHLLPWTGRSFLDINFDHIEVAEDYFLSGHVEETLPINENLETNVKKSKYKVFSEYSLTREFLTSDRFEIVYNEDDADILWYTKHFKTFQELNPTKFVNQFPFEYVITIKDLLSITCRRNSGESIQFQPSWLPITYNLKTELPQFISYYQHREKLGLNNHWIVKPFNLARGLDTHVTDNINYIIRVSNTGPKIVQKYIENPVLFYRPEIGGKVKFDVRYVILLKSVRPLDVYVYKNFFLRFANQPFEMANFGVYEKHFTVMNYTEEAVLKHMLCEEFVANWTVQYPEISWGSVEDYIFKMLRQMFECATLEPPPCGIAHSPQSRALYAADIMLEWSALGRVQPKILEVNWTPDCKRACDYYNNFYNDIFGLLFLNEEKDVFVKV